MPCPKKANELQQILMASQWMSRSIPDYNKVVVPLQDILEAALKDQPRRTKRAASKLSLAQFGWSEIHYTAFDQMREAILISVQLSYPDSSMIQCVFCDDSYYCSSGVSSRRYRETIC